MRYFNYFLAFARGMLLAFVLDPASYGYWAYLSLIITFIGYINFGSDLFINAIFPTRSNLNKVYSSYINSFTLIHIILIFSIYLVINYFFLHISFDMLELLLLLFIGAVSLFIKNYTSILRENSKLWIIGLFENILLLATMLPAALAGIGAISMADNIIIMITLIIWLLVLVIKVFVFNINSSFSLLSFKIDFKQYFFIYSIGLPLLISNIAFYLIIQLNKYLIKDLVGYVELGYFNFASSITYSVLMAFGSVIWAVFPKLIKTFQEIHSNTKAKIEIVDEYQSVYSFAILLLSLIVGTIIDPILSFFLPKYLPSVNIIYIMMVAQFFISSSSISKTVLIANLMQKQLTIISFIGLLVSASTTYYLLQTTKNGLVVAGSICFSYFLISAITTIYLKYNLLHVSKLSSIILSEILPWRFISPIILFLLILMIEPNFLLLSPLLLVLLNRRVIRKTILLIKNEKTPIS